jgi:hypothetical protein
LFTGIIEEQASLLFLEVTACIGDVFLTDKYLDAFNSAVVLATILDPEPQAEVTTLWGGSGAPRRARSGVNI